MWAVDWIRLDTTTDIIGMQAGWRADEELFSGVRHGRVTPSRFVRVVCVYVSTITIALPGGPVYANNRYLKKIGVILFLLKVDHRHYG